MTLTVIQLMALLQREAPDTVVFVDPGDYAASGGALCLNIQDSSTYSGYRELMSDEPR